MVYDQAITVFSPDGHLLQVDYATEAANKGLLICGVVGKDCVVLASERKEVSKLKDPRSLVKLHRVDEGLAIACAGLQADARVLVNKTRLEAQSYRLNMEDAPPVDFIGRWVADTQQRVTMRGGMRPYGVSCFIAGFNSQGEAELYNTDPSANLTAFKAWAAGRSNTPVREYLQNNWKENMTEEETVTLASKALSEVVEMLAGNLEIWVVRPHEGQKGAKMDAGRGTIDELEDAKIAAICEEYHRHDQ